MPENTSQQDVLGALVSSWLEEWHNLPVGSWAWPQVAMYQVLIDRFATLHPEHCEKLPLGRVDSRV